MQKLLDISHSFAIARDVVFNHNKTKGIMLTSRHLKLNLNPNVHLSSSPISFINNICYLGFRLIKELSDDCDVN